MSDKQRLLFVDDEQNVLDSLARMLRGRGYQWELSFTSDPAEALERIAAGEFDAIVTDVRMPGIDGFELLRRVQAMKGREHIPIVVLTGSQEGDLKRRALDLGATDLLSKPVAPEDLVARLRSVLTIKRQHDELRAHRERLAHLVRERTLELEDSRHDIVWRLGKAAEHRDEDTGYHIVRVSLYSGVLAEALGFSPTEVETLFLTSPLHDVGKIGIPDDILLKPSRLTDHETRIMRRHCEIGAEILCNESLGMMVYLSLQDRNQHGQPPNPLLSAAATICLSHHERWDGTGYPHGLSGDDIPVEGRIVALADVFDALSSRRPYKPAFPEAKVVAILDEGAGNHFDPAVHDAFERSLDTFREIRQRYADEADEAVSGEDRR